MKAHCNHHPFRFYKQLSFFLIITTFVSCLISCSGGGGGGDNLPDNTLTAITVTPDPLLFAGTSAAIQLSVTGSYSNGGTDDLTPAAKGTRYIIDDTQVATVDSGGLVTAAGEGTAVLTVTHKAVTEKITVSVILAPAAGASEVMDHVPGEVIALVDPRISFQDIADRHSLNILSEKALDALGYIIIRFEVPAGRNPETLLEELNNDADVVAASYNAYLKVQQAAYNDPYFTDTPEMQYGLFQMRTEDAHHIATGSGVRVAIIDSGLDLGHPEFASTSAGGQVVATYNSSTGTADVTDTIGHGTHVAGIIGALTDNGTGISAIAPDASLIIVKVMGIDGGMNTADVIVGMNYAMSQGAQVMNLSLVTALNDPDDGFRARMVYQLAVNAVIQKGCTVVASAGNDQQLGSPWCLPAALPNVIAVGASDADDEISTFSNLRHYVDVTAPGAGILSTIPLSVTSETFGISGYDRYDGTSMAAPHVTGVVALMLEANPNLNPCEIQSILEQTAVELGEGGKDPRYGSGRVDALAAVTAARDNEVLYNSCNLAVVGRTAGNDIAGIDMASGAPVGIFNAADVPWEEATSIAADSTGDLYVTAIGGIGTGLYRVDRFGEISAVALGAPFVSPQGLTVGRDGNILVVDDQAAMVTQVSPQGSVTVIHSGAPLVHPTGIDYTEESFLFLISDSARIEGDTTIENQGMLFSLETTTGQLSVVVSNSGQIRDFKDVVSWLTGNLFSAAVYPSGSEDHGFMHHVQFSPISAQTLTIDYPDSTETFKGIGMDWYGRTWVTDSSSPEGTVIRVDVDLIAKEINVARNEVSNTPEPVDVVHVPPRTEPVSPAEIVYLTYDHLYFESIGESQYLDLEGALSDYQTVDLSADEISQSVVFTSMDESIAVVTPQGKVTAMGTGAGTIKINGYGLTLYSRVFVGMEGITLYYPAGADRSFDASGSYWNHGDFQVPAGHHPAALLVLGRFPGGKVVNLSGSETGTWYTSTNPLSVIKGTVQYADVMTFLNPGTSIITAQNGPFSDSVAITVGDGAITLSQVSFTENEIFLFVDETRKLTLSGLFSNGQTVTLNRYDSGVVFSASNSNILSVDNENGSITGNSPGEAVVTGASTGLSAALTVHVSARNEAPDGFIDAPADNMTITQGQSISFVGHGTDSDGQVDYYLWNFMGDLPNINGAETGPVSFAEPGTYTVYFVVMDNKNTQDPTPESRQIIVLPESAALAQLEITNSAVTLHAGALTADLEVVGHYADGTTLDLTPGHTGTIYTSSDTGVATVSADGSVIAVANGTSVITAANSGFEDTITVTVEIPAPPSLQSIDISDETVALSQTGATRQLSVIGHYSDGSQQDMTSAAAGTTYVSSDTGVATVSQGGLVTALANGSAVITATNDGFEDTVTVTVSPVPYTYIYTIMEDEINHGELSRICWQSQNATMAVLDQGSSSHNAVPTGCLRVYPDDTTTYTLTAHGPGGTDTDATTIQVHPPGNIFLERVGHIGGYVYTIAVSGNYACVGMGASLEIIDISNPAQPVFTGRVHSQGSIVDVTVSGNYAYVLEETGLHIINITDPAAPYVEGSVVGIERSGDVELAGNYAYVAGYDLGVVIIDVSTPSDPVPVGAYRHTDHWNAANVAIAGGYAYVTAGYDNTYGNPGGLWILDLAHPETPTLTGSYETAYALYDIRISGNHAYVAAGTSGLLVFDVTTPSAPAPTGSLDTPGTSVGIWVTDGHVYIADDNGGLVTVLKNSAPSAIENTFETLGDSNSIAVSGAYGFLACGDAGMQVVDLTVPSVPAALSWYATMSSPFNTTAANPYCYVADSKSGLFAVDASDPGKPLHINNYCGSEPCSVTDVVLSGPYAYASASQGLAVLNISDPLNIVSAAFETINDSLWGLAVRNPYLFLCTNWGHLRIYDIMDPLSAEYIGQAVTIGLEYSVSLYGNYAYAAKGSSGMAVIDVSDPYIPVVHPDVEISCHDVEVYGSHAYVAGGNNGLLVYALGSPATPIQVGQYDQGDIIAGKVAVSRGFAFATSGYEGLYVIDVTDPGNPKLSDRYDRYATSVAVDGRYVYLSSSYYGMSILRTNLLPSNILLPSAGNVRVTFVSKNASFDNDFLLLSPTNQLIFQAVDGNVGNTYELGSFQSGDVLELGLYTPEGHTFSTDHDQNHDECIHVMVTELATNTWRLRWEDGDALGDEDFNDVVVDVTLY